MEKGFTELVFLLDRSGSMEGLEQDTINGFNGMIEKQRQLCGECLISTVLFNHGCQVIHDRVPLSKIQYMTEKDYFVNGCTALIDAIGSSIEHISKVYHHTDEEDIPEKTIFVITTDGMENASRHYDADQVRKMVKRQQEKGWEFLFLGANIDAVSTAKHFGILESRAVDYMNDSKGVSVNYEAISAVIKQFRENARVTEKWKSAIERDHSGRQ